LNNASLCQLAKVRAGIYRLFSQLFYLPDDSKLSPAFITQLEEVLLGVGLQANGLAERVLVSAADDFAVNVKVDFVKLFHRPDHALLPPYECLYRGEKQVMGESTMAVVRFYRDAGLELDQCYADLPDHMSAELSFLAFLCDMEAKEREQHSGGVKHCLELQRRFYSEHLGAWLKSFCDATIRNAQTTYYRELPALLHEWCALDQVLIKELLIEKAAI